MSYHHTEAHRHSCCDLVMSLSPPQPSLWRTYDWPHSILLNIFVEKTGTERGSRISMVFLPHLICLWAPIHLHFCRLQPPVRLLRPHLSLFFSVALPTVPLYFPVLSGLAISYFCYVPSAFAFMSHLSPLKKLIEVFYVRFLLKKNSVPTFKMVNSIPCSKDASDSGMQDSLPSW